MYTVKWFQVLLYKSQFNISHLFAHLVFSIWPIDRTLSAATTPDQSVPGSDGNEKIRHISQISKTGASPSDCLMSYLGRSLSGRGSYLFAKMLLVLLLLLLMLLIIHNKSLFRLRGHGDETVNHLINGCSKLAKKEYKNKHDWVGELVLWELYKRLKFDHTNKQYQHRPESILENETHKILRDFEKQADHWIQTRRPNLMLINKKKGFVIKRILLKSQDENKRRLKEWQ